MSDEELSRFFPDNKIWCDKDLEIEDGTYEIWQRDVILNIFEIKNKRITHYYKYNVEMKLRLNTFLFEYIKHTDGSEICNVYRKHCDDKQKVLICSSHWHLYPEEHKQRVDFTNNFNKMWDSFVRNTINTSQQFDGQVAEVNIDEGYIKLNNDQTA
jgi:hypothetical protein